MSIFNGTPESLAALVPDGIQARLYAELRAKLMASIVPMVESTARDCAAALVARVESYHNLQDARTEVVVNFTAKATEAVQKAAVGALKGDR